MMYEAWSYFVGEEVNAWWLMMLVFTATCITFIYTNAKIRERLDSLDKRSKRIDDFLDEAIKDDVNLW